jgi:hypothetical protein
VLDRESVIAREPISGFELVERNEGWALLRRR